MTSQTPSLATKRTDIGINGARSIIRSSVTSPSSSKMSSQVSEVSKVAAKLPPGIAQNFGLVSSLMILSLSWMVSNVLGKVFSFPAEVTKQLPAIATVIAAYVSIRSNTKPISAALPFIILAFASFLPRLPFFDNMWMMGKSKFNSFAWEASVAGLVYSYYYFPYVALAGLCALGGSSVASLVGRLAMHESVIWKVFHPFSTMQGVVIHSLSAFLVTSLSFLAILASRSGNLNLREGRIRVPFYDIIHALVVGGVSTFFDSTFSGLPFKWASGWESITLPLIAGVTHLGLQVIRNKLQLSSAPIRRNVQ